MACPSDALHSSIEASLLPTLPPACPPTPPPPAACVEPATTLWTPYLDEIEDVHMYKLGGYHPINLGDVLDQRYKVLHKLGNGGFALAWLARDLHNQRYVALKILKADAPTREIDMLKSVQSAVMSTKTPISIAAVHRTFTIRGPNGIHQCVVMDVGGPSLRHLTIYCEQHPASHFSKTASKHLAATVAALHAAGICHGDLTDSNVLFAISHLDSWTESQIYDFFGHPETAPIRLLSGAGPLPSSAPASVVAAPSFPHLDLHHLSGRIMLVDFGEAFTISPPPASPSVARHLGTPASFSAPELMFDFPATRAVDLWALGCLLFQLHAFRQLLPTFFGSRLEALSVATETIGALPATWLGRFQGAEGEVGDEEGWELGKEHRWFDPDVARARSLDVTRVKKLMPQLGDDEGVVLLDLLWKVLVFEPGERMEAREVMEHEWFEEVRGWEGFEKELVLAEEEEEGADQEVCRGS